MDTTPTLMGWRFFVHALAISIKMCYTVSVLQKTYHFDSRGSTIAITDANGVITDTYEYDTYGKLISHTGDTYAMIGYKGRDGVITDDNGLIYMRARYYSPKLRRFINADVIAGDISDAVTSSLLSR